ncbi:MAG: hypothetical protein H6831_12735 [Planctomycetes bacterium]|nr:hypothetical protein [Planctomycetota bacterium]
MTRRFAERAVGWLALLVLACAPAAAQEESAPSELPPDAFLESIPGSLIVTQAVRARFDVLLEAVRSDDEAAFRTLFDVDELIDRGLRITEQQGSPLERVAIAQGTVTPLLEILFAELRERVGTHGTQLRMEKAFEDGTTYVVLRTRADADLLDRYVHFCLRGQDVLSIVDFEFEDAAVWASEQVAFSPQAGRAPAGIQARLKTYALAFDAALDEYESGDSDAALEQLVALGDEAKALGLQAPVVHFRTLMENAFGSGRIQLADRAAQELIQLRPSTPLPRFYRGRIALDAGYLDAARVHLANYQRLVGPDAQALAMIGDSYEQMGEVARARDFWLAALDQNPDLTAALYSLGVHTNAENAAQLVERFRGTTEPLRHFEVLVGSWSSRGLCEAVAALCAARREDQPRDPNAYYYDAACALQRGDFERACELALAGRELVPEDARRPYDALWVEAAWSQGDPLEAYRLAPDKAFAFDAIAEQLVFGGGELAQLVELIELRRADDPQDVWIPYYQGQAYHAQGRFADADDHFRIGYTHAIETDDADRAAAYRLARTDNAYAGGSAIAAYTQMPEEDVWRRLLELILTARDGDTLAQLIALRRELHPDDPQLGFWLAHAQIISGQEEAGLQRLMARRGEFAQDPDLVRWLESDLVRANLRLGRFDQALVFAEASTRRDGNPFFEFLVQVARGNAEAAGRIYERLRELGYGADHVYGDHDVGQKLISDPAFAQFRTLWPPPAARR